MDINLKSHEDNYDCNADLVNVFKDKIENHLPVHPLTMADVQEPEMIRIMIKMIIMIIVLSKTHLMLRS